MTPFHEGPADQASAWQLDPDVDHLNHGSFGATPIAVLGEQQRWRDEMERNPVRFMVESYQPALEKARDALASFIGADPEGLVFVNNATAGVNGVLRSLESVFGPGDEIVTTDHGYNACRNAVEVSVAKAKVTVRVAMVPFPIAGSDAVVEAVLGQVTERTRLVVIDHITSPTGLVFPVERIVEALEPDVAVLVDGAHAPGIVPLDLEALGASYAVGNCHKWMCAPKGAGYLHAREDRRDNLAHAVISHGYNGGWPGSGSPFHARFDWIGTDDPSAWLSVPAAINTMGTLHPDGWPGVRRANHELTLAGRDRLLDALGVDPPAPNEMIGSLAAVPLPDPRHESASIFDDLTERLRHRHRIEVPVFTWPEAPHRVIRISAQLYNTTDQYERLAVALREELDSSGD
jgi:isopenicillin-N epimerase